MVLNSILGSTDTTAVGVVIVMLGGLAGAVFYLPLTKVKSWAWESYWLVYALFGLLIVPGLIAYFTSPNLFYVLGETPSGILLTCFIYGAAWGFGGLTWGLMIRYLGVGLGLAIGCGLVASIGTIVPKAIHGDLSDLLEPGAGIASLMGIVVSLAGIVFVGMAGMSKENELSEEDKKKAVAEFNFKLGIMVALFSGVMSSAMNFGLQGGPDMEFKARYGSQTQVVKADQASMPEEFKNQPTAIYDEDFKYWVLPSTAEGETVTANNWRGMPVLMVVLLGGLVVNFGWCLILNLKNNTITDYTKKSSPILFNILFAALAGGIWCSQFVFAKSGEPRMGALKYMSWPVLMSSAIMFSSLLGIIMGEWKGTGKRTRSLLAAGLVLLLVSAFVTAYSGHLSKQADEKPAPETIAAVIDY